MQRRYVCNACAVCSNCFVNVHCLYYMYCNLFVRVYCCSLICSYVCVYVMNTFNVSYANLARVVWVVRDVVVFGKRVHVPSHVWMNHVTHKVSNRTHTMRRVVIIVGVRKNERAVSQYIWVMSHEAQVSMSHVACSECIMSYVVYEIGHVRYDLSLSSSVFANVMRNTPVNVTMIPKINQSVL